MNVVFSNRTLLEHVVDSLNNDDRWSLDRALQSSKTAFVAARIDAVARRDSDALLRLLHACSATGKCCRRWLAHWLTIVTRAGAVLLLNTALFFGRRTLAECIFSLYSADQRAYYHSLPIDALLLHPGGAQRRPTAPV